MMKKNIRQQLAYWAAALLLTACSESEKLTEEPHDNTQGHNIGFSVDLSQDWYAEQPGTRAVLKQSQPQNLQMTGSGGMTAWLTESTRMGIDAPLDKAEVVTDDELQTRGTLVTQRSEMDDFSTICFHDGSCHYKNVKSDNAGNLISPHRWWDGWSLRFYALHPYDSSDSHFNTSSSNEVRYTYTGGTTAAATKDLMYASTAELPYTADGIAPLHFNHALTAVSFAFGNNPDFDKTITSIQLQNVYTSGTLVIPKDGGTATWDLTGQEKTGTVTLALSPGVVANTSAANTSISSEKFFMIPQSLDGVVIKIVFSDNKYLSRTLTSSSNWNMGTTKTYTLNVSPSDWTYHFEVTSPNAIAYTATSTGNYGILSYRQLGDEQQPVAWTLAENPYEIDEGDGNGYGEPTSTLPSWLTNLSRTSGNGGVNTTNNTGYARLTAAPVIDKKAQRDQALQQATAKSNYDLSQGGETANCYVISAPGTYKIPLIYGNARKADGSANDTCFNKAPFVDNSGSQLTQKEIKNVTSSTLGGLVWTDIACPTASDSVVTFGSDARLAVDEEHGFLLFTVNKDNLVQGNAVVGIYNMNGANKEYLWSWHLWFAPQSVLEVDPFPNNDGLIQRFSKEPLGLAYDSWSYTAYDNPRKVCVTVKQSGSNRTGSFVITQSPRAVCTLHTALFQWGRKDAFPGTKGTGDSEGTGTVFGRFAKTRGTASYATSIKNPGNYYYYYTTWCNSYYYNDWCADLTSSSYDVDKKTVKTVYDPCPAGFRVPRKNAFTGFTVSGSSASISYTDGVSTTTYTVGNATDFNNNKGWTFARTVGDDYYSVFFPAAGYRDGGDGTLNYVGTYGYYCSAVLYDDIRGRSLYFRSGGVSPLGSNFRSYGFSVRPVQE